MTRWFRVDTSVRGDPLIAQLAERLDMPPVEALGHCVYTWAAITEHRPDGNLTGVSDSTLEQWAEFKPDRKKRRGLFIMARTANPIIAPSQNT